MKHRATAGVGRREFLGSVLSAGVTGLALPAGHSRAAAAGTQLLAGEGVVDITPPIGIEMGGFHRKPGNERRVKGNRQPTAVRALVLSLGDTQVAICSLDVATVGHEMAARIAQQASAQTGMPAAQIRVCATHTHSMPAFCYLRQWGALPVEYMGVVEKRSVEAIKLAKADLAPAEVHLGKTRITGGNHNRTTKQFKTDAEFTKDSTDAERWLDTTLHALRFERAAGKRSLLWYHFSAHAVCFADDLAGPDWPGIVAERIRQAHKLDASFLQGHSGDVNPGDGRNWRGEAKQTTGAITPALERAIAAAAPIRVDRLRTSSEAFQVPLDLARFKTWLDAYRADPAKCRGGQWVDDGFAADWFRGNADRDLKQTHLPITLSAIQLGPVGMVFHPSELYSYYGLAIRRGSPLPDTLVVGYTDGIIGYLPDPKAYEAGEYSAMTVPKILDYPPFTPTAAQQTTAAALDLLKRTVG